ncbi:hypothetical protein LDC_2658 [sediment metagenome]|uniref:Uncharacterized protein n=1 Tax=sediment metagenome TaxID=749907 RepID=D9PM80_9ZZZZ
MLTGWVVMDGLVTTAVTVTLAVPLLPLLDAVTVYGPPAVAPAVNTPEALIVPPPDTLHVKIALIAVPNWSLPAAVNVCVPPVTTLALDGVTATVVSVWLTVTVTDDVTVRLPASLMVTCKV